MKGIAGAVSIIVLLIIIVSLISGCVTQPPEKPTPSTQLPPKIVNVETFQEGDMVFFRLFFTDPNNDAEGFGFRGAKGSGWGEETHPFKNDPSKYIYARVSLGRIEYPFNHRCETGPALESDVVAWIYDSSGLISSPVTVHLACQDDTRLHSLVWPFDSSKGQWAIIYGYRGAYDHAPGGSANDYALLAFDFAKCAKIDPQTPELCDLSDGWARTTGETVLSPVSGTIKWIDSDCAGLSIEIDNAPGYYVALFHLDGYPNSGHVSQGNPIGTVSNKACNEKLGWSGNHIHMVLYHQTQLTDPNTREAIPFSNPWGISGCEYLDDRTTYQQHLGRLVPCS